MYDAHKLYLVENPINRYSIGDRTPGLQYGADGSLTIYMQKDSPGADKESNWLPTPDHALVPTAPANPGRKLFFAGDHAR